MTTTTPSGAPARAGAPPPLRRNRDFLLLWTGAGATQFGARIGVIAYPLLVLWGDGTAADAGLVAFAGLLPMLVLQLPAGVMVDRWDRRRLMLVCNMVGLATMVSVVAAIVADAVWLPHLLVAAFVDGAATIFYQLAERTAVRNVVHEDHLPSALAQNEARGRAAGLLGQPVGGAAFAVAGWLPFGAVAAGHLLSLINLRLVKTPFQEERAPGERDWKAEVMQGLSWLWGQKFLRAAIGVVAVTNLLFQIVNMAPLVVIKDQGGSAAQVGLIGLVSGVGGVVGALSGGKLLTGIRLPNILIGTLATWSVLVPVVALTTRYWAMLVLYAAMSAAGAALNVGAGAYMAQLVPDEIHGKAMSAVMLSSWGANSLGALAAGFLLAAFSTGTVLLGVSAALLLCTLAAALSPSIRRQ
ncbi:MFS transporter [Streptomyces sp. SID9944]|nr:MFS transporter [Streptomyces sp. SID5998]NED76239.1 MFS transporter [Streptomyces sp. SID9944]